MAQSSELKVYEETTVEWIVRQMEAGLTTWETVEHVYPKGRWYQVFSPPSYIRITPIMPVHPVFVQAEMRGVHFRTLNVERDDQDFIVTLKPADTLEGVPSEGIPYKVHNGPGNLVT